MNQKNPLTRREATFRTAPIVMRAFPGSAGTGRTIVGMIPYNSKSVDMGFLGIIPSGASLKTLRVGADVKALFAHDVESPLSRPKSPLEQLCFMGMRGLDMGYPLTPRIRRVRDRVPPAVMSMAAGLLPRPLPLADHFAMLARKNSPVSMGVFSAHGQKTGALAISECAPSISAVPVCL